MSSLRTLGLAATLTAALLAPALALPLHAAAPAAETGLVVALAGLAAPPAMWGATDAERPEEGASSASRDGPLLCVLDTGVDPAHVDLDEGKLVAWRDFLHGRGEPYDDSGHGTHVAATAAGSGEAGPPGAAPLARLAVGKVLGPEGGTVRAAAAGLAWCAALGATVVNLSLEEKDCRASALLADAVASATRRGVLVVSTSGNRGDVPCSVHSPGSLPEVLTVGALDGPTIDATGIARFSGRGDGFGPLKPDLVAPGTRILGAKAGTERQLVAMDGTSMAAPHVAGVAALLRQAHPEASPAEVAQALRATARDGGPAGHDTSWGHGVVDGSAASAWLGLAA